MRKVQQAILAGRVWDTILPVKGCDSQCAGYKYLQVKGKQGKAGLTGQQLVSKT